MTEDPPKIWVIRALTNWRTVFSAAAAVGATFAWASGYAHERWDAYHTYVDDRNEALIDAKLEPLRNSIQELHLTMADLAETFEAVSPVPRVAEYDEFRSEITTPDGICFHSEICSYVFRFRRTVRGMDCDTPSFDLAEGRVINHDGQSYPVRFESVFIRGRSNWDNVEGQFWPPQGAEDGLSEFMIDLVYTGCSFLAPGERHVERTAKLRFYIDSRDTAN